MNAQLDAASGLDAVHCSSTKQLLVCTRSLWNRSRGVCCHISCWHLPFATVSFVFGQFGESLTNTNLTSREFANLKTLVQTRMGDMNGHDSRSAM